jgi:acyl-CoA reductase-like NAD-dependent aldehyde dehydrogenase
LYSDLFVAAAGEAPLVASVEERFDRWHSVSLKDVLELEWMALAKAARTDVFEEPLVEERSCVVRPMTHHVLQRLATHDAAQRRTLAEAWKAAADNFAQWPVEAVERVVTELEDLARRASREGKAVLYLATW